MSTALQPAVDQPSHLRADWAFQGLTNKQEDYCQARIGGLDIASAYRLAYEPAEPYAPSVWQMAGDVEHSPKVTQRLKQLLDQRAADASLVPTIDRTFVLNGIAGLALHSDKDATRLRAYELLGKADYINLFRETKIIEHKLRSIADVDVELRQRLGELAKVVEGSARRLDSEADTPAAPADRRRKPALKPKGVA